MRLLKWGVTLASMALALLSAVFVLWGDFPLALSTLLTAVALVLISELLMRRYRG